MKSWFSRSEGIWLESLFTFGHQKILSLNEYSTITTTTDYINEVNISLFKRFHSTTDAESSDNSIFQSSMYLLRNEISSELEKNLEQYLRKNTSPCQMLRTNWIGSFNSSTVNMISPEVVITSRLAKELIIFLVIW